MTASFCKLQIATEVVVQPLLCRLRRSSCCRFQQPQGSPSAEGAGWLSPCWSSSRSARRWRPQIVASPNPCLIYLDSRKCLTTDIELDSFTEWWKHIIWCWSIIWWFFTFYIFSSHKTKIMLLYKKMNFMTFHHMMTFHHIPYDGLSTFLYYNVWWDSIIYWCLSTMDRMIPINYTIATCAILQLCNVIFFV